LRTPAGTGTNAVNGLYIAGGTAVGGYYNTIFLNDTSTSSTTYGNTCIYASTTPTVTLRNNVAVNLSKPGATGGFVVAYRRSAAVVGLPTYAAASDNNCWFAGVPDASHLIFYDAANSDQTLVAFKTRVAPRDAYSVTELPPFVNIVAKPYDLHINTAIGTQLESGALPVTSPISITTDYDGESRIATKLHNNVHPDIGADEFSGIPIDNMGPAITYIPLLYTSGTGNRTLTATITDAISGVTVDPGKMPKLVYQKNRTGAWIYDSLTASPWTFTFDTSKMESGIVTAGDSIFYYVTATDSSNNVATNPAGAPTTLNYYLITAASLSGDYTVGAAKFNEITGRNITFKQSVNKVMREVQVLDAQKENDDALTSHTELVEVEETTYLPMENGMPYTGDLYVKKSENPQMNFPEGIKGVYATITAAVADLNLRGVSGATNFLLVDSTYLTETCPIIINVANEMITTALKPVTIKPNTGVSARISATSAVSQIFRIVSSYITIDGSNAGSTDRSLIIQNTSVTTPQVIGISSIGTTPTVNVTVKNCVIINGINSSSAVVVGGTGYFNNITIQNNSVQLAYIGIYVLANAIAGNGSGTLITGNDLNTSGANSITLVGVYVQGVDGAMVTNNNIGNYTTTYTANITGIWFATATINSTISGNTIGPISITTAAPRGIAVSSSLTNSNITISGNTITGLTTSYSSYPIGIYVFSTTTGVIVEKNKVSNISNTNTGGYGARGIYVITGVSSSNIIIKNNFVWNIYATADASSTYWGIGIAIEGATAGVGVYYNSVNLYGSYAGYSSATVHAAFAVLTATAASLDVRDNIFVNTFDNTTSATDVSYAIYTLTANTAFTDINNNDYYVSGTPGVLGYLGSNQLTLAAWRIATGKDAKSISADPLFTSATDLHIPLTINSPINRAATPIGGITVDIDNEARNATWPDIGADEYTQNAPGSVTLISPTNNQTNVNMSGRLYWNKTDYTPYYDVYFEANNPTPNKVSSLQTDTFYDYAGLSTGTDYYWKVVAWNDTNPGAFDAQSATSPTWKFTTVTPPNPPSNITLTSIKLDSIYISFVDNAPSVANPILDDSFFVYRKAGSAPATGAPYTDRIAIVIPPTPSDSGSTYNYQDFGLSANTRYYYRVTAFNTLTGESNFAANDAWTAAEVPGAPTFSDVAYFSMKVYLTPGTNPASTEYVVKVTYGVKTTKYFDYVTGALVDAEVWGTYAQFGGASGKKVSGLTQNTAYTFAVKARNGALVETAYGTDGVQTTDIWDWMDDFESTDGGYVASGNNTPAWQYGTPTVGPVPHSGTNCWGTVVHGDTYPTNALLNLGRSFKATQDNPKFDFFHWYDAEPTWDGGNVKISSNGTDWTLVYPQGRYPSVRYVPAESAYSGSQRSWQLASFVLPVTNGQEFFLKFDFSSDGSVNDTGWYIDDVMYKGMTTFVRDVGVTAVVRPAVTEEKRVSFTTQVTVINNGGQTEDVPVIAEIWGAPPTPTLSEGFEGTTFPPAGWDTIRYGASSYNMWTRVTSGTSPTCTPHGGTAMAKYYAYLTSAGYHCQLISPYFTVGSGMSLSFWMTHDPGYPTDRDSLVIEATTDGITYTPLASFLRYAATFSWQNHNVPLTSYVGYSIRLAFHAYSRYGDNIYLDDISVVAPWTPIYRDSTAVLGLTAGDATADAYFTPYTISTEGSYNFKTYTTLLVDNNPSNNLMTSTFTVNPIPLVLVSPTTGTTIADNTPSFDWDDVAGATQYRIDIATDEDFNTIVGGDLVGTSDFTVADPDALSDGTYYWRAHVTLPLPEDPYSDVWTFTIDTEGPVAPVLVAPADLATVNATPTLSWEAVGDAVNYNLVVDDGITEIEVINIETTDLTYTVTIPLAELTHAWKVRAQDAVGNWGDFQIAPFTFTVDATPPDVPTTVSPTEGYVFVSETQTFEWNAVTDGAEYELSVDPVDDVYLTTATTYDLTLGAGSYTFKVRARDAVSNWSDYSAPVGFSVVLPAWVPAEDVPAAPDLKVGKFVKDGGAMVTVGGTEAGDAVYMFPGNKSWQFYKYDDGVYTTLESIPYGVKPTDPLKINKKKIGKGAALCYDGTSIIYATKGNGTRELWAYDILANTWTQKAFVPVPKALKGGTSIAYLDGILYLLAGGQKKTDLINFYSYDPLGDTLLGTPWTPLGLLTLGPNIKIWKDGACLTALGGTLYALKSNDKYNPFFSYEVLTNTWTEFDSIPMVDSLAGKLKKVAVKDGGAICASGDAIYAIKGGGTIYFWKYTTLGGWTRSDSIPRLDKKSVAKTGAALTYADGKVWLIKGNNRQELWRFNPLAEAARVNPTTVNAVMIEKTSTTPNFNITISPNPFTRLATINYTVPVSGKVTLKLYNVTGSVVETMNDGYVTAGTYTMRLNANTLAKGIYFLKYENNTNRAEIKLIVQ
jgi:hypothetical protein